MAVSPETLMAFIDGELSIEEARRVAAEVANDPALCEYVEKHRALKARLQAISRTTADDPGKPAKAVSETLTPAQAPQVDATPPAEAKSARPRFSKSWIPAAAMAAGIGLGLLLAGSFGTPTDFRNEGGAVFAQGDLARALSAQLALDQKDASLPVRIRDSFFSKDGYFCRSFLMAGTNHGLAGIACREGGNWRVATLAEAEPGDGKDNRPSTDLPASIRGALNTMMVGDPLDDPGERAARGQDWTPK